MFPFSAIDGIHSSIHRLATLMSQVVRVLSDDMEKQMASIDDLKALIRQDLDAHERAQRIIDALKAELAAAKQALEDAKAAAEADAKNKANLVDPAAVQSAIDMLAPHTSDFADAPVPVTPAAPVADAAAPAVEPAPAVAAAPAPVVDPAPAPADAPAAPVDPAPAAPNAQ